MTPLPRDPRKPDTEANFYISEDDANPDPQGLLSKDPSPEENERFEKMLSETLADDDE